MEQYSSRLEYKVGLFVAIGLLVVTLSILALGGNRIFLTRYANYRVQFSEVQGLFPGSVVSLAGVPVGNIKKIDFGTDNKLELLLLVNVEHASRITEGSTAEIRTQGALGDKFIYISPGPNTAKPIEPMSLLPANDSGDFLKMLNSKEDGAGRAFELIKEMHLLVASLNQHGRPAQVMANLADITGQFKKTIVELDKLVADLHEEIPKNKKLSQAVTSLNSILEKIDKGQGSLGQLINDPSVHQSLKSLLGGSPRSKYIKSMLRESIQQSEQPEK